jgi:hypothetical protein
MKGTDRFLIGIVAGAVLLVAVVLAIALLAPNRPGYRPDDTPDGVAHNYLLALHLEDYARAHSYLSPTLPGYPAGAGEFAAGVESRRWNFASLDDDVSLAVESVRGTGDRVRVLVRETRFYEGGLFDLGHHSSTFDLVLVREEGAWRISESARYWNDCWSRPGGSGCP